MKTLIASFLLIGAILAAPYCIWSLQIVETATVQCGKKVFTATALSTHTLFLTDVGSFRFSGCRLVLRDGKVRRAGSVIAGRGYPPIQIWEDATADEEHVYYNFFPRPKHLERLLN